MICLHQVGVHYPVDAPRGKTFPLISYAHGLGGGGPVAQPLGYDDVSCPHRANDNIVLISLVLVSI